MRKAFLIITVFSIIVFMSGCFPTITNADEKPAGFFLGIWHGWIAPVSLIAGIFNNNIRIYEANNSGWWYDFGFYIAVIAGFGGIALSRKKHKG